MHTEDKKEESFKCKMCGSKSTDTPGVCCGGERKPAGGEMKCEACEHKHKEDGSCDCGCK